MSWLLEDVSCSVISSNFQARVRFKYCFRVLSSSKNIEYQQSLPAVFKGKSFVIGFKKHPFSCKKDFLSIQLMYQHLPLYNLFTVTASARAWLYLLFTVVPHCAEPKAQSRDHSAGHLFMAICYSPARILFALPLACTV